MREYIQRGYMRIADIMPILGDIRIAYIPKLGEMFAATNLSGLSCADEKNEVLLNELRVEGNDSTRSND